MKKGLMCLWSSILILLTLLASVCSREQFAQLPKTATVSHFLVLAQALDVRTISADQWFEHDFSRHLKLDEQYMEEVRIHFCSMQNRLSRYPDTKGLQEMLQTSIYGAVTAGSHPRMETLLAGPGSLRSLDLQKHLKVVYFGAAQKSYVLEHSIAGASYDRGNGLLFVPAIVFADESVGDAIVLHELKHVEQFRSVHHAPTAPTLKQEVEAHRLSGSIMDIGVRGSYKRTVAKIVTQKRLCLKPEDFFLQLNAEDMLSLDELFFPSGPIEIGFRKFQYYFDLGDTWIAQTVPEAERPQASQRLYSLLVQWLH